MAKQKPSAGRGPAQGSSQRGPSQRMLRVGELIRHRLAELLARGDIHDDTLAGAVVTIPEVRMSPDLKRAIVYVMPLGGHDVAPVIAALKRSQKFIRSEVARAVNLKYAPEIFFREDQSFEEATRIDRLLDSDRVRRDVKGE
jgi:ribosome-binding factor A